MQWFKRMTCGVCEYHIALGYPCMHQAMCLCLNNAHVDSFNKGRRNDGLLKCPPNLWWWHNPKFFHPDHDIKTALHQSEGDTTTVIPAGIPDSFQLYPPDTSIPRMRRIHPLQSFDTTALVGKGTKGKGMSHSFF